MVGNNIIKHSEMKFLYSGQAGGVACSGCKSPVVLSQ